MTDAPQLALGAHEVHLWYVRTAETAPPRHADRYLALLSREERDRHRRFLVDRDRWRFLLSHAFVRTQLSCYAPVPPEDWVFRAGVRGRPEIDAPAFHGRLRFNLSHTDGLAVLAIARDREVGVDVEALDRPPVGPGLARRYFSPEEVEQLDATPESRRHETFLRFWTLKESYIKARGLGLALPLDRFSFVLAGGRAPSLTVSAELEDDGAGWQFVERRLTPRHLVAVAIRRLAGADAALDVREAVLP